MLVFRVRKPGDGEEAGRGTVPGWGGLLLLALFWPVKNYSDAPPSSNISSAQILLMLP